MNSFVRNIATLAQTLVLSGLLSIGMTGLAHAGAGSPGFLNNSNNNNSNNNAIRRANPNSRQGTQSISPPVRGPNATPNTRQPTLENGGIGNGYPTRQQPSGTAPKTQRGDSN